MSPGVIKNVIDAMPSISSNLATYHTLMAKVNEKGDPVEAVRCLIYDHVMPSNHYEEFFKAVGIAMDTPTQERIQTSYERARRKGGHTRGSTHSLWFLN